MRPRWAAASAVAVLACLAAPHAPAAAPGLADDERAAILALGPWPPAPVRDPANPASGLPAGIALGEALFHSPRLSPTGVRCASCHEPWRGFVDARTVALGVAAGTRNTPSLLDVARHRRFGWDGGRDRLWAQCLRPLADPREMPATDAHVAALVRSDAALSARLASVFGAPPGADDARVAHAVGLALAAYVETLASPRTPFDAWRDRLAQTPAATGLPAAARRGARLFAGTAGCASCHAGPTLGDDALHRPLAPLPAAQPLRTPGLRGVAATGPWFHDGSATRLCDAVRPHAADPGASPPRLDAGQRSDLVAFLRTLSPRPVAGEARCDP